MAEKFGHFVRFPTLEAGALSDSSACLWDPYILLGGHAQPQFDGISLVLFQFIFCVWLISELLALF